MKDNTKILRADIADMESVYNDPSTPADIKKAMSGSLQAAKEQLKKLESAPAKSTPSGSMVDKYLKPKQPAIARTSAPPAAAKKSKKKKGAPDLSRCKELLEKYGKEKKTEEKRIADRKKQGKPVELTPSETVRKAAGVVKNKVEEVIEKDKKLPAAEIDKLSGAVVATVKNTLKGIVGAVAQKKYLADIIKELQSLQNHLPKAAEEGMTVPRGNVEYIVMNDTDGIMASPETYPTREAAQAFIDNFPKRFEQQGYYLTSDRRRIDPKDVQLSIDEFEMDDDEDDDEYTFTDDIPGGAKQQVYTIKNPNADEDPNDQYIITDDSNPDNLLLKCINSSLTISPVVSGFTMDDLEPVKNTFYGCGGITDKYAFGGRPLSAINRDRAYKSDQEHELNYNRKTRPRNPRYKK